jgi:hypothetical protein
MLGIANHKIQTGLGSQPIMQDTDWADTHPGATELIALVDAKNKLERIDFLEQKNLRKNVDSLLNLDQLSYKKVKRLTHNYLIDINKNRVANNDSEVILYDYHRALYLAYTQILDAYENQVKLKFNLKYINLILARFLNATFMMAKYRYYDDQPAPVGAWDYVHKVITIAENLTLMNKSLFLYEFQIKETSLAILLKRGFMLSTLQKGSYSKLQIELTDRVLKIWASNPLIVNTYKQGRYQFGVKLENDAAPDRVRTVEKFIEYRFWRSTRLVDLMESFLCAVDTNKSLRQFGLEKAAPTSVLVKLFKKLRVEWCVEGYTRQRRLEKRNKEHKLLRLSHGVDGICRRLASLQSKGVGIESEEADVDFETRLAGHTKTRVMPTLATIKAAKVLDIENYWTVDESENGFAIDFGSDLESWVDAGVLVGYNTAEDENTFGIAEIRSVRKLASGQYRAGFKIISKDAKAIEVLTNVNNMSLQGIPGYFVDGTDVLSSDKVKKFLAMFVFNKGDDDVPALAIPRIEYQRDRKYTINIKGVDRQLKPGRIISKQRDWICFEALF